MKQFLQSKKARELLIIFSLGLTPLLWFKNTEVILGHDAGLTLSPIAHFLDRLSLWTERFGFGVDQSYAVPGFFIHGLEALVALLGFNVQWVQKIVFIFWFVLPGLTMFYLAKKLEEKFALSHIALPASIFYMFNHFLLQGWFVAERTKFSLYAALPLVVAFLFDWEKKEKSTLVTAILISITLFFLNGLGSLPLFGGILITFFVFIFFYFLLGFSTERVIRLIFLVVLTGGFSLLLQAYWLIPFVNYILHAYSSEVAKAGGGDGILGWIFYISKDSSLINILRLQGVPEWYQNPLHPYANILFNPLLQFISFLIPIVAFSSLLFYRGKKIWKVLVFFALIALVSMIFMAGSHPPFGPLYLFLINYVPGFIAFRTPFYKFAPALWFAYALLISFSIAFLYQWIKEKNTKLAKSFYVSVCVGMILYCFPFLTGSFFDYIKGVRSMRVIVPSYIYEFGTWSEGPERANKKTILLPPPAGNVDAYTWGYWSLAPLTTLLTNASIVTESGLPSEAQVLTQQLYEKMKKNDPSWIKIAQFLGIESFVLRNDFAWDLKGSLTDKPSEYRKTLDAQGIKQVKKFGEWEVYDLSKFDSVKAFSSFVYLVGNEKSIVALSSLSLFEPERPFFISSNNKNSSEMAKFADTVYIMPECLQCDLAFAVIDTQKYTPLFTRGAYISSFVSLREKMEKKIFGIQDDLKTSLYRSLSAVLAIRKVIDEKREHDVVLNTIEDYKLSLLTLEQQLARNSGDEDINDQLMEMRTVLRLEKREFLDKAITITDPTTLDLLKETYDRLLAIENAVDKRIWVTKDEEHKKFIVSTPITSSYNVLYRSNDEYIKPGNVFPVVLDGKKYMLSSIKGEGEWLDFGELSLTKGEHLLEVKQPVTNLYQGSTRVEIVSTPEGGCNYFAQVKGKKGDTFRISFFHTKIRGEKKFFVRTAKERKISNPLDTNGDLLEGSSQSYHYEKDISLDSDGEMFAGVCYPPSLSTDASAIAIEDIILHKLAVPDILFYTKTKIGDNQNIKYTSSKKSNTKYTLKIEGSEYPYLVTLNEAYSLNWVISSKESVHVSLNGYKNGWIVKSAGETLGISYKPQDFMKIGFILTSIGLIVSIFVLVYKFKK